MIFHSVSIEADRSSEVDRSCRSSQKFIRLHRCDGSEQCQGRRPWPRAGEGASRTASLNSFGARTIELLKSSQAAAPSRVSSKLHIPHHKHHPDLPSSPLSSHRCLPQPSSLITPAHPSTPSSPSRARRYVSPLQSSSKHRGRKLIISQPAHNSISLPSRVRSNPPTYSLPAESL